MHHFCRELLLRTRSNHLFLEASHFYSFTVSICSRSPCSPIQRVAPLRQVTLAYAPSASRLGLRAYSAPSTCSTWCQRMRLLLYRPSEPIHVQASYNVPLTSSSLLEERMHSCCRAASTFIPPCRVSSSLTFLYRYGLRRSAHTGSGGRLSEESLPEPYCGVFHHLLHRPRFRAKSHMSFFLMRSYGHGVTFRFLRAGLETCDQRLSHNLPFSRSED